MNDIHQGDPEFIFGDHKESKTTKDLRHRQTVTSNIKVTGLKAQQMSRTLGA